MHTKQQAEAIRREIKELAAQLSKQDMVALLRVQELGSAYSFAEGEDVIKRTLETLRLISISELLLIPSNSLQPLKAYIVEVQNYFVQIQSFSAQTNPEPIRARNSILESMDQSLTELYINCRAISTVLSEDILRGESVRRPAIEALDRLQKDISVEKESWKTEIEAIIQSAREASSAVAVKSYSQYYKQSSDQAKKSATRWLVWTIVLGTIVLGYLIYLVFVWAQNPPNYTAVQAIQVGGAKIALFTVLFYLISWTGRNYKAQCHLREVNMHRSNTLNTLEAFAAGVKSADTREAIFLHASNSIFAQVSTGFIPDQSDAPNTPAIMEIFKTKNG